MVNRDPEHLRRHALTLAQQHNLTNAIQRLYTPRSPAPRVKNQRQSPKRSRKYGRKSHRASVHYNPEHAQAFPIVWPIAKGDFWISTGFGPRRHPKGHWEFHQGIDMASPRGTPVFAAASGVVVQAQFAGGYGNTVIIAHDHQHKTRYAHLSKILVSAGDYVSQGDIVGKVGSTGNVRGRNGVHLHFEVIVCDKRVNPLYFLP